VLLYRVFPHLRGARKGRPGHPLYVHAPQGSGRLDNPDHYLVRYFATTPAGAVAEAFGTLTRWAPAMFAFGGTRGSIRALGVFEVPDDLLLLDLDDARALLDRRLRPTQVVTRDRSVTQTWALRIFQEPVDWAGVRWWSYYRPEWPIVGLWRDESLEVRTVEPLALDHPAVEESARELARELVP
jgi:hypothetical protein